MKTRLFVVLAALALVPFLSISSPAQEPPKLKVITTILPVYCFTVNVAGDLAEVENILPGNVGPHDYQFSIREVRKVTAADLIILNGLGLENWMEKLLKLAAQERPKTTVHAAAGLARKQLIFASTELHLDDGSHSPHRHHHDSANPHIWLDPQLAAHSVTNILNALKQADPRNAAAYEQNAARYLERLRALDADIRERLRPVRRQPFITFHDAFPYFTRRYDLKLVGVIEEVPDVEPSLKYLQSLRRVIQRHRVKVIFTEPQFPSKLVTQLARDLKIQVAELDPLETGPLTPTAYEEGMRRNARALQENLK